MKKKLLCLDNCALDYFGQCGISPHEVEITTGRIFTENEINPTPESFLTGIIRATNMVVRRA